MVLPFDSEYSKAVAVTDQTGACWHRPKNHFLLAIRAPRSIPNVTLNCPRAVRIQALPIIRGHSDAARERPATSESRRRGPAGRARPFLPEDVATRCSHVFRKYLELLTFNPAFPLASLSEHLQPQPFPSANLPPEVTGRKRRSSHGGRGRKMAAPCSR